MKVQAGADISWIGESLDAAGRRLDDLSPGRQIHSAVYVIDECRLLCIVSAVNAEDVHRLLAIALLPSARVYEVNDVLIGRRRVRHPARDLDPGVDPQAVEDVGDMCLDSPLRKK